jgi:hypothetical protein
VTSGNGALVFEVDGGELSAVAVPSALAAVNDAAAATDGSYLGFAGGAGSPYNRVFHNNAGSLTNLTIGAVGDADAVGLSADGAVLALGVGSAVSVQRRSGSGSGATYAAETVATAPGSSVKGVGFAPDDGGLLAVAGSFSGYVKIYRVAGSTWSVVSNQPSSGGTLPDAAAVGVSWSAAGDLVAVATAAKTFIYERSGDTLTYRATLGSGGRGGFGVSDGYYLSGGGKVYRKSSVSSWAEVATVASAVCGTWV